MEKRKAIHGDKLIRVAAVKKRDKTGIRLLILLGVLIIIVFTKWFFAPEHIGHSILFWLLSFALVFKLLKMLHEWYHYWDVSIPAPPAVKTKWTVDVFTTACPGEPKEMIINTLMAMQNMIYPHTSYLCDEGDDPELKQICKDLPMQ